MSFTKTEIVLKFVPFLVFPLMGLIAALMADAVNYFCSEGRWCGNSGGDLLLALLSFISLLIFSIFTILPWKFILSAMDLQFMNELSEYQFGLFSGLLTAIVISFFVHMIYFIGHKSREDV